MDRKDFFLKAFRYSTGKSFSWFEKNPLLKFIEEMAEVKQRPPGAAPEEAFLKLCTGCDACMAACPVNIVMIEDLKTRYPLIYTEQGPCIHCDGYPCIQACPTGALQETFSKKLRLL